MAAAIQNRVLGKGQVGEGRRGQVPAIKQQGRTVGVDRTGQHREKGGWERRERNNGRGGRERVKSSKQARKGLTPRPVVKTEHKVIRCETE